MLPETHFELLRLSKEDLDPAIFAVLNRSIAYERTIQIIL